MIKGVQDYKLYHFAWVDQRKLQGYNYTYVIYFQKEKFKHI